MVGGAANPCGICGRDAVLPGCRVLAEDVIVASPGVGVCPGEQLAGMENRKPGKHARRMKESEYRDFRELEAANGRLRLREQEDERARRELDARRRALEAREEEMRMVAEAHRRREEDVAALERDRKRLEARLDAERERMAGAMQRKLEGMEREYRTRCAEENARYRKRFDSAERLEGRIRDNGTGYTRDGRRLPTINYPW